jgi:hypothetical protein
MPEAKKVIAVLKDIELNDLIGAPSWEQFWDRYGEFIAEYGMISASDEFKHQEDVSQDRYESAANKASEYYSQRLFSAHERCVRQTLKAFEQELSSEFDIGHGIEFEWTGDSIVVKANDLESVALVLLRLMNGYGFAFSNLKEALESGPYTLKKFVQGHLHWLGRYDEIYGTGFNKGRYDRCMEIETRYL